MQFLKTLFWVALAVILVLFATVNWSAVTINLWGGLQADVKLPVLIVASFLAGFLPMLAVHRARIWTMRRRLEALERQAAAIAYTAPAAPAAPVAEVAPEPVPEPHPIDERIETDNKVWPAR
jgi:putative membrane protein